MRCGEVGYTGEYCGQRESGGEEVSPAPTHAPSTFTARALSYYAFLTLNEPGPNHSKLCPSAVSKAASRNHSDNGCMKHINL